MGQYDKAIDHHEQSLKIRLQIHGLYHTSVAHSYHSLGSCYKKRYQYNKAIEYNHKALEIKNQIFGKNKSTADSNWNLGLIFEKTGEIKSACKHYEEAWRLYSTLLGEFNERHRTKKKKRTFFFSLQSHCENKISFKLCEYHFYFVNFYFEMCIFTFPTNAIRIKNKTKLTFYKKKNNIYSTSSPKYSKKFFFLLLSFDHIVYP
ncbi:hypothetical protein RFI_30398 [Reticulomyxa filosa]|uniref:Uncharacterized protein n=1 Tax=Reticulomyxa filosa TaxID=46433 RepID=X6M1Y5_RETFI|nr:hypothetical protein RFI_30398 [Reticulomyxa filosa]|eukprot:ETO06995.1 hypothetical protein RFI_30398 [Reticulomyxa filosa]